MEPNELKVWVHRVGRDGASTGVAGVADVGAGRHRSRGRLHPLAGDYLVAIDGAAGKIIVNIEPSTPSDQRDVQDNAKSTQSFG